MIGDGPVDVAATGDARVDRLEPVLPASHTSVIRAAVLDKVHAAARSKHPYQLAEGGVQIWDGAHRER